MRPDGRRDGPFTIETGPLGERLVGGMHRTAAALAGAGLDVIVDHVLLEDRWLDDMARRWVDLSVLYVGVRCPLAVVLERERARHDRTIGQAAAQFRIVHRRGGYDVEVDTSRLAPDEAAARIVAALERGMPRPPFPAVRAARPAG